MDVIIGLGEVGCNIAQKFADYPQYDVYCIDSEKRKLDNFLYITPRTSHEEYEQKTRLKNAFFKEMKGHVLFVVSGGSTISGASLRILEKVKHLPTSILYIKPDPAHLSSIESLHDRATFGILQQYTRSAIFERLYVVDNARLESIIVDAPVMGFYDRLNELIVSTVHMINVCDNSKTVINTFSDPPKTARISTLGIVDPTVGEEKIFYDLTLPREKVYYYAINRERLESEGGLLRTISQQVKEKSDENLRSSFGIYPTDYEEDYAYCLIHATLVQEENVEESV